MKYALCLLLSLACTTAVATSSDDLRLLMAQEFLKHHPIDRTFSEPNKFRYKVLDIDTTTCSIVFDLISDHDKDHVNEITGVTYRTLIARMLTNNFMCTADNETVFTSLAIWLMDKEGNVVFSNKTIPSDLLDANNNFNEDNVSSIHEKSADANAVRRIRADALSVIEKKL